MRIDILLQDLQARLPELEWKLAGLGRKLSARSLPKGLFRPQSEPNAAAYIAEIKADLDTLAKQKSEYSSFYLAQRIKQKINVLATLCQLKANKVNADEKIGFGLKMISTRQQWLQSLENEINLMMQQQESMEQSLIQMQVRGNTDAILGLQAQLGELEKRLTLAKETFARA